jgi:hypothetical protein
VPFGAGSTPLTGGAARVTSKSCQQLKAISHQLSAETLQTLAKYSTGTHPEIPVFGRKLTAES